ncbi:MAG TPA: hypothetical protein VMG10_02500 [Gemmataceae bacterium]|nr:hypothetical protein [Gemmataceae bacterium]
MLLRYGLAAILAAVATLTSNVVWAQDFISGLVPAECCAAKDCCAAGACCKDGKCCKDGECCCKGKKCDASCACCKDNKCECGKGDKCCCKDGKCSCKDGKCCWNDWTTGLKLGRGSCPFLNKLAKGTTIIMVMPASLPLPGSFHAETMGMLPHPQIPMGPQVMLPVPLPPPPPMLTPPGLPVPTMHSPIMPPQLVALPHPIPAQPVFLPAPCGANPSMKDSATLEACVSLLGIASELCSIIRPLRAPSLCAEALGLLMEVSPVMYAQSPDTHAIYSPQCIPPSPPQVNVNADNTGSLIFGVGVSSNSGLTGSIAPSAPVVPCAIATPTPAAKVRIIATPYDDKLEMNVGDETCIRCKKMTVTIGENEIRLSRFDDRVRVRGEELKAIADSVRSDRKDHLILEGDVVLRYKKDGHSAHVTGDRIELNLSSGAVTIKPAARITVRPAARIERVDTDE